jgi:hypothetical protein
MGKPGYRIGLAHPAAGRTGAIAFACLRRAADAFPKIGFVSVDDLGEFVGNEDAYQKLCRPNCFVARTRARG